MCLIIYSKNGLPDTDLMRSAHHNNSNGFGLMYLNDANRIVTEKVLPGSFKDIEEVLERHPKDQEMGLHFRLTTKGQSVPEMAHPFQVLDHNKHGRDLWLMHNGPSLPVPLLDKEKSDTWHFVNYILKPMLDKHPELIEETNFINMLDRMIGTEKLLLLDTKKGYIIVNENAGKKLDDMWLSNTYSVNRNKGMNYNVHTGKLDKYTPPANTNTNRGVGGWNSTLDWEDWEDWQYDPVTGACTKSYSYENNSKAAPLYDSQSARHHPSVERLTYDEGEDRLPFAGDDMITVEELIDAYTEDKLYEFVLDRFEGTVNWLRSLIAMDEAV